MKKIFSRRAGLSLMVLCAVCGLSCAGLLVYLYRLPQTRTVRTNVYTFTQDARVVYRVRYTPGNAFFPGAVMGPGKTYLGALVDGIDTDFTYRFQGEGAAAVRGRYQVLASMIATTGQDKRLVWQKDYVLCPETTFLGSGPSLDLERRLPIDFPAFVAFGRALEKAAMVQADNVDLFVTWQLQATVRTSRGAVQERLAPQLVIPINQAAFQITGDPDQSKQEAVMTVRSEPVRFMGQPVPRAKRAAAAATAFFLICLLPAVWSTDFSARARRPSRPGLPTLLKKYGNRLAESTAGLTSGPAIPLVSLEELVKVADDLSRPIIYHTAGEETTFWVCDGTMAYSYVFSKEQSPAGPGPEVHELRRLAENYTTLIHELTNQRNRINKLLREAGLTPPSPLKVLGLSEADLWKYLSIHGTLPPLSTSGLQPAGDDAGAPSPKKLSEQELHILRTLLQHLDQTYRSIRTIEAKIRIISKSVPNYAQLLVDVPGVDLAAVAAISATTVMDIFGHDYHEDISLPYHIISNKSDTQLTPTKLSPHQQIIRRINHMKYRIFSKAREVKQRG